MDISDLTSKLEESASSGGFISLSLSRPSAKDSLIVRERWTLLDGVIRTESFSQKQAFQASFPASELADRFQKASPLYGQAHIRFSDGEAQCLRSRSGSLSILFRAASGEEVRVRTGLQKKKRYLLDGDSVQPFLVELGIQSNEGKIRSDKQAKFRQICRFIELVDALGIGNARSPDPDGLARPLRLVDFGCGKAYLTFALYHFLAVERGLPVIMTGLDTKSDVIAFCSELAGKVGFSGLTFRPADIASWDEGEGVDLAISLHACDTATDIALAKAAAAGAGAIMSVPCCQHELSLQIQAEDLRLMTRYGLLKERFASLATDGLRASLMRVAGYTVDLVEFVDAENSPKNIMLRCVRKSGGLEAVEADSRLKSEREREWKDYQALRDLLGVQPTLERLLAGYGLLPRD